MYCAYVCVCMTGPTPAHKRAHADTSAATAAGKQTRQIGTQSQQVRKSASRQRGKRK